MKRRAGARAVGQTIALTALLGLAAWAALNVGRGFRVWQHGAGQAETVVYVLPGQTWGYGTTPLTLMHGNGTTFNGGSLTRYGCFAVARYDLRFYHFNPWTGVASYACG